VTKPRFVLKSSILVTVLAILGFSLANAQEGAQEVCGCNDAAAICCKVGNTTVIGQRVFGGGSPNAQLLSQGIRGEAE
jgi:hypothetical protein